MSRCFVVQPKHFFELNSGVLIYLNEGGFFKDP